MFQGNWTCSKCGGAITQLPFEPRSSEGLTCRDCYFKAKDGAPVGAGAGVGTSAGDAAPAAPQETPADSAPEDASAVDGAPDIPAEAYGDEAPTPTTPGERKMFEGDWQCGTCGSAITQLPFQPRSTANLKCIDCFKQSKA